MKSSQKKVLALSLLTVFAAVSAQAGTVLRLKAGNIKAVDESARMIAVLTDPAAKAAIQYQVIQFDRKIKEADKKALKALGIESKAYLPDDALIVKGQALAVAQVVGKVPGVRAVIKFQPSWKLSSELAGKLSATAGKKMALIRTIEPLVTQTVAAAAKAAGIDVKQASGRMIAVEATPSKLVPLSEVEGVEYIQLLPTIKTSDFKIEDIDTANGTFDNPPLTGFESGTKVMGFTEAWARGYHGEGQVVAMADTGTDVGKLNGLSADLNGAVKKGYPMGSFGLNTTWADGMGHGTHVSGSVVSSGAASGGVVKGGAYGAKFVAEGMFNPLVKRLLVETDFNKLMGTPLADGARIHTNSWGAASGFGKYDAMAAAADEVMWQHPELLILFAAGNSGTDANGDGVIDANSIGTPGTAKNVLTVGASENTQATGGIQKPLKELGITGANGQKTYPFTNEPLGSDTLSNNAAGIACFSSRGPTTDGRVKPEIVAPGTNILSTRSHQAGAEDLWGKWSEDYVWAGGTSMATPLTAGAAAVTRQYLVQAKGLAEPSGAMVKAALMHTARDLFPGQYGMGAKQEIPTRRPNSVEGYGRVDMDKVTSLGGESKLVDAKAGVATGEEQAITLSVGAGEGIRVTLAWTDAPAAANAQKTLVNDLDLVVSGPGGSFTKGDHTNNHEMVEQASLAAGEYRIVVKGGNVPNGKDGKQPYALIATRVQGR